jgi:hypothetical protein
MYCRSDDGTPRSTICPANSLETVDRRTLSPGAAFAVVGVASDATASSSDTSSAVTADVGIIGVSLAALYAHVIDGDLKQTVATNVASANDDPHRLVHPRGE